MKSLDISSKEDKPQNISKSQKRVFALTYLTYIMVYFLRKPWSTCKLAIGEDLNLDLKSLGAVDTGFLVAYALGQIFLSPLGDLYGPRCMITVVLMGSGFLCAVLSAASDFNIVALTWTLNGAFQALAFPLMMKALSPWFPSHIRGKVFGLWTTSQGIGGVLAVSFGGYVADSSLTWRGAFALPAMASVFVAILVTWAMLDAPSKQTKSHHVNKLSGTSSGGFQDALKVPYLTNLGVAYFCVKLARYTMLAWLPTYLAKVQHMSISNAAYLSTMFDIGSVLGAVSAGFVGSNPRRRIAVVLLMSTLAAVFVSMYDQAASFGYATNTFMIFMSGFMIAGPDSILGGTACSDICDASTSGAKILSSATGLVNGMGSLGAILSGMLPVFIFQGYGWNALFVASGMLCFMGGVAVAPVLRSSDK